MNELDNVSYEKSANKCSAYMLNISVVFKAPHLLMKKMCGEIVWIVLITYTE